MSAPLNDAALREAYARLLAARAAASVDRDVPLESLVALVERRGSEQERLALLDRVMASPALRAEFDELRAAAPTVRERSVAWHRPAALAASLVLVAGIASWATQARRDAADASVMRGGAANTSGALTVERIAGDSLLLHWPAAREARAYTVELLDPAGAVVATRSTRETSARFAAAEVARARSAWLRIFQPGGGERTTPAIALPVR